MGQWDSSRNSSALQVCWFSCWWSCPARVFACVLSRYQEALETEVMCIKLRNSCLTPTYIVKDLQGRGLVTVTGTTAGPLIRLAQRK